MRRRRFYRRKGTAAFGIISAVIIFLTALLLADAKLRPAVYDLAALEAGAVASKTVNCAVEQAIGKNGVSYYEIAQIIRDENGNITGITTDIVKLNLFKAQITKAIDDAFLNGGGAEISVPLGAATGISLLAGAGPEVEVSVGFSSATHSDFDNVFRSSGINQTQHSVMLNISSEVIIAMPGRRITKNIETSFCVAQNIIVGSVPDVLVGETQSGINKNY